MSVNGWLQIAVTLALLLALVKPLGAAMAAVLEGRGWLARWLAPLERGLYRLSGVRADEDMDWKAYTMALLAFNALGLAVVMALQMLQGLLPLNPDGLPGVSPHLAFNTATSFATNTNWQSYGGETTLGYAVQMLGLTVQNFVSAATGIAVLLALVRGFTRARAAGVGNFWVDLVRSTLYVLLPLSLLLALFLASQGVVQTFRGAAEAQVLDPGAAPEAVQHIARGPAASQVAIKQLGTNGGGFFNVNSAHPLENPTPLSNLAELLSILLISAALCYSFGRMVRDRRQGWALLAAMFVILVPLLALACVSESGNLEGKETRFGVAQSSMWATFTTAASNGSVNSMHDSYTPLGGLVPMVLMQLGEVVFGGVGSGLYGMLVFAIVAVFVAGLMVGRTPEYLGKKIEAFEMKMASLAILAPCLTVLVGTAVAVACAPGRAGVLNPGPHGFSEILYAFSSAGNNNGSAFAGLTANTPFYNLTLAVAMLVARYGVIVPVLAIAGSLARKKSVPASSGTLPTHGPLFVALLVGTVLLVGALTFAPALALGPIIEHLQLLGHS
ncbi:MAG: potassium-transporting ATPase subunit KdpA [Planctomycetota bacterium]|nr:MAG: potassium-transporting ATPase subunit KdpA [Planctomycetota bacterium]